MKSEGRIQEKRTADAIKNNLMGAGGKLGCILKALGNPVIQQFDGNDMCSSTYLPDFYETPSDPTAAGTPEQIADSIPTAACFWANGEKLESPTGHGWRDRQGKEIFIDEGTIGLSFDGLRFGMHLDIKFMLENTELSVYYQGYLVYREVAGQLLAYVPSNTDEPNRDWESKIDYLYKKALPVLKQKTADDAKEDSEKVAKNKLSWLQGIRERWGV